jgi:putative DNA primase/helicase
MLVNKNQIPKELIKLDNWVVYSKSKIPMNPITSMPASSTDSNTWSRFPEAINSVESGYFQGIGFVLTKDVGIICIDIDNCLDDNGKIIDPKIDDVVNKFNNKVYIEKSPSNKGLHILVKGDWHIKRNKVGNIEVYDNKRYIIVTGNRIQGSTNNIIKDDVGLENLISMYFKDYI